MLPGARVPAHPRFLTHSRRGRLLLFGTLYFVQGALFAYVLVFNNLYLRSAGASAAQLSWLNGLLVIPFILKIGIGVVSDRVSPFGWGHRLPYMIAGLLILALGVVGASFVPPIRQFGLFVALALAIAFGLALYDTVADGLAVDVTPPEEVGLVQGSMSIGRALGLVALAAGYGRLIDLGGWQPAFWLAGGLSLLPLPLLAFVAEPPRPEGGERLGRAALRALWRPEIGWLTLFALLYSFVVYGANAIVTLFANEGLGASLVQVGDAAALSGMGMLAGGGLVLWLDRRRPVIRQGAGIAAVVSLVLFAIAGFASLENVLVLTLLWGACLAAMELVFVTLAMALADPRLAAGTFAIFMAISNVGTGLGQATTTGLIDVADFRLIFAALGAINLLCLPLLWELRVGPIPSRAAPTRPQPPG